ncbi:MAG: hypothetical protein GQ534_00675, partial [Candidatus Delongbacteria bacterium]|nr:hypothetical protein [Candidatus Delongbacteria bacterium]
MLRYFDIILILIFNILYSSNLFEYFHEYNDLDGNIGNVSNFFDTEFYDWEFSDELFIKYNPSDTPLYNTYKNNYARNHLRISRSGKNHFFSAWISGEIYSNDNYSTDFIGLEGDYRLKQGVSTGMDIVWNNSSFKTAISGKYLGRNYKLEGIEENEFDGNMVTFGEVSLIKSKKWQPFIDFFHFNDLNENNYLGYSKFSAGIKYKNKFKREYVLKQQISAGYTDLYQNIPYLIQSDTRFSAKFGQKWMGFSKIYFQFFADDELATLYSGNSFTEFMIQRNFSIDKDNYFARMRAGIVINP